MGHCEVRIAYYDYSIEHRNAKIGYCDGTVGCNCGAIGQDDNTIAHCNVSTVHNGAKVGYYADAISHNDDTVNQSNGTIEHNAAQYPT